MLSIHLAISLSLAALSTSSTLPNIKRGPGILRLPVQGVNTAPFQKSKRQEPVSLANVQNGTQYVISFSIGTPPQPVSIQLDTGSSETWVNPNCSTSGSHSSIDLCNSYPKYNPLRSTTSEDTGKEGFIPYGIGSVRFQYYKDNFHIGGVTITGQHFGVTKISYDVNTGTMGVGPPVDPVDRPEPYLDIIDELASQGITNSRAFSLDLRSVGSPEGAIIFGGIDTKKYKGSLEKCPIIPAASAPNGSNRYWITLKSVGITKPGKSPKTYSSSSIPVFLDSGTTVSLLPQSIFDAIVADFPGATPRANGFYTVDCAIASQLGTIDFTFGNTIINVPYREFLWHSATDVCVLGLLPTEDNEPILGDSFLRAAYVVYDQDNRNIHLANEANCGQELVSIGKGPDAVPSITGGCSGGPSSSSAVSPSATLSNSRSSSSPSSENHTPTITPVPHSTNAAYSTPVYVSSTLAVPSKPNASHTTVLPPAFTGSAGIMTKNIAAIFGAVGMALAFF